MISFFDILNSIFLIYSIILFSIYIFIAIFSSIDLLFYTRKSRYFRFETIKEYKLLPTVSIIAPAYNEEKSIVENIKSLLSLDYPNLEVIVVNDGSTDNSLQKVIEHYSLVKVAYSFKETLKTQKVRGIYKSTNIAYSNLIYVDKENGGKADALNVGINISRSTLFMGIDVDCIIEKDAILRMVKTFLEENNRKVIAAGGVVRIANSCDIKDGRIVRINYPKNFWAKFQTLEYFRAFTLGRMAWARINGLIIVSGAFGMFDRQIVLNVGGYDTKTVGEDFELVLRMRKYMHKVEKKKYKVAFIPDPLCWTEVPEKFKTLRNQRNRWTRGSIDTVLKHKDMLFRPKYGITGILSFPYWVLFEWLAPLVEAFGLVYFMILIIFSTINVQVFLILLAFIFFFSLFFSLFSVFYETMIFNRYKGFKFIISTFLVGMIELFVYHPLTVYFAILGNYTFFIKQNKKGWGKMARTGFNVRRKIKKN